MGFVVFGSVLLVNSYLKR